MAWVVNGETIDSQEIEQEFERLKPHWEREQGPLTEETEKTLREWARETVIERILILQAAAAEPDLGDPEEMEKIYASLIEQKRIAPGESPRQEFERQFHAQALLQRLTSEIPEPTEEEARASFEANPEGFQTPEVIRAAHIVKHLDPSDPDEFNVVRRQMDEILERLNKGESFEALAFKSSDCPSNGGDLGFFARGQMVDGFEDVVFGLEPGQTSGVFRTEFGYHIARVSEKRPAGPVPFEEVAQHIHGQLINQRKQEKVEAFLDTLWAKAEVKEV